MRTASAEAIKNCMRPRAVQASAKLCSKQRDMLRELLSILCSLSAVHTITDCSALPNDAVLDCGRTSPCLSDSVNNVLQPIPTPAENQYSCYSTCIASGNETEDTVCVAVSPTFPLNEMTKVLSGPYHLQQYQVHKIFSPRDDDSQLYSDSHFCKYHVTCSESDTFLSVVVESLDLEPAAHCQPHTNTCLDYIQLQYPTGSVCTICGSDLVCQETGRRLEPLLVFNGQPSLLVEFSSNRINRSCGFRLLATCTRHSFFESSNCNRPRLPPLPPPPTPFPPEFGKRDIPTYDANDVRSRRYFSHRTIQVYSQATVVYDHQVVKVRVGDEWLYRFQGVYVLQVYNEVEGPLTFYGTANGRSFPGYGYLSIGYGIIQYIQESVPSQFHPTEAERRLIELLHRGMVATIDDDDDDDDGVPVCRSKLTKEERSELEQVALQYDSACNGFLRAAACGYQQLHRPWVSTDCLKDVPFPPPTSPPTISGI